MSVFRWWGSLSASRSFRAQRSRHRPFQAESDPNCTDVSEARTSLYCYYMQNKAEKAT